MVNCPCSSLLSTLTCSIFENIHNFGAVLFVVSPGAVLLAIAQMSSAYTFLPVKFSIFIHTGEKYTEPKKHSGRLFDKIHVDKLPDFRNYVWIETVDADYL